MSDSISFTILTDAVKAELRKSRVEVDKATKGIVSSAGKLAKNRAQARVRMYSGPRRDVPRGRLKKAIKTSRLRPDAHGGYSMTVTPQGYPAHAYADKIEKLQPFMAPARAEMDRAIRALADAAWDKAIKAVRG